MMTTEPTAILLGYGSVGRRHARVLTGLTPALVIVDGKAAVRNQAALDYPEAQVAADLDELDAGSINWANTIAVIATWGPSHAALFHALADRGARRIVCEKPLAHSVALAADMARRASEERISLAVHHYFRYAGIVAALRQFLAEHELGEPVAVVVHGGAACLVTNGIHWVDFACELYDASPRQVLSTAQGEPLNPRAPDLGFYGGTAVWSFDGGRELVMTLSNRSSVAPKAQIYLRDAVAEMDMNLHVTVRRRDLASVARYPAITRTGPALEPLFDGQLPGVLPFEAGMRAAVEDVLRHGGTTSPTTVGAAAVSACIGALVAGREHIVVDLPFDPSSAWAREHWPIS